MSESKEGYFIVLRSANGRDGWEPVNPEDAPDWLKHPDVMGRLVAGMMANDPTEGETGSDWFRAVEAHPETLH